MASRNALASDFKQIIRSVERGEIDTDPWITHRVGCDDMIEEFDNWLIRSRGLLKPLYNYKEKSYKT